MKILVAYDGSRFADAAVDEVLNRPWPEGSEIRLVTAIEQLAAFGSAHGLEGYATYGERLRAQLREDAYRRIVKALERLGSRAELAASYDLREGDAKSALLEAIREWRPDLVLVGSHGKSAFERLFLGSVSHALVSHAPCNVEIVKVHRAA